MAKEEELNREDAEIIYIPDEEGHEEEFEVIMKFEVDQTGQKYMMVVPLEEQDGDEDEVYAFRYEEDGEDLTLYTIENEEEWQIVEETFHTLLDELDMEPDDDREDEQ